MLSWQYGQCLIAVLEVSDSTTTEIERDILQFIKSYYFIIIIIIIIIIILWNLIIYTVVLAYTRMLPSKDGLLFSEYELVSAHGI